MKTKNLTPFLFGAKLTSRKPPELEMTAVVRGTFRLRPNEPLTPLDEMVPLSQGLMSAEAFHDDDVERKGECTYGGDFADYKLNAEVMLRGTCYAPGGHPLDECPVRLSVGGWSKALRVVGRRAWSDSMAGAAMSKPIPFSTMPLGYTHAYGGPGYALNPSGKGFGTPELPNVERPGEPVRSPKDTLAPAGFGPINPAWPERAGKVGRAYGASWRAKRAPFYAEDFDWTFFHAAPPDQQIEGFLRGDEEIALQNLHPSAPSFSARLPGLRVRVFVKDDAGRFREIEMSLDTVFIAPDEERIYLTWRGLDRVREDDLVDVRWVLIASEDLAEAPHPVERYRAALEAFERDPLEIEARTPERLRDFKARLEAPAPAASGPAPDPVTAALQDKLGALPPEERETVLRETASAVAAAMSAGSAAPGADFPTALAKAVNDNTRPALPRVLPFKPGYMPAVPIGDAVRNVAAQAAEIRASGAAGGHGMKELEEIERLATDPRLAQIDPSLRPGGAPPRDEPGPGRDLSGLDFTGRDLRGHDLSGANLEATILTGANLTGVRLAGANLKYAVLVQAEMAGADLSSADLTSANLTEAHAREASFAGARFDRTFFRKTDLAGARFAGAEGELSLFTDSDLSGASLSGVKFYKVLFRGAKMEGADLSSARLTRCYFLGAAARRAKLAGALLDHVSFAGSDLASADAKGARGEGSIWLGAVLDDADFSFAVLLSAHFSEARATRTRFYGANLKLARFYRASLEQADFTRANLFGADFGKAQMSGARFVDASLYGAAFVKAAGAGCVFDGANLKRSTLENA